MLHLQGVENRDVIIPQDLEDAMSRQAQAERARQARVILGEKDKGALVIVPSSAVETMNLGGLSGMVALAKTTGPPSAKARGRRKA